MMVKPTKKLETKSFESARRFLMLLKQPVRDGLYAQGILTPVQFLYIGAKKLNTTEALEQEKQTDYIRAVSAMRTTRYHVVARPLRRFFFNSKFASKLVAPVVRLDVKDLKINQEGISCANTSCRIDVLGKTQIDHDGPVVAVFGNWIDKFWSDAWEKIYKKLIPKHPDDTKKSYENDFPAWPSSKRDDVPPAMYETKIEHFESECPVSSNSEMSFLAIMLLTTYWETKIPIPTLREKHADILALRLFLSRSDEPSGTKRDLSNTDCKPIQARVFLDDPFSSVTK